MEAPPPGRHPVPAVSLLPGWRLSEDSVLSSVTGHSVRQSRTFPDLLCQKTSASSCLASRGCPWHVLLCVPVGEDVPWRCPFRTPVPSSSSTVQFARGAGEPRPLARSAPRDAVGAPGLHGPRPELPSHIRNGHSGQCFVIQKFTSGGSAHYCSWNVAPSALE